MNLPNITADKAKAAAIIAGALAVGFVAWKIYKNLDLFNPTSHDNIAASTADSLAQALTGDKYATTGTATYSLVDTVAGWFGGSDADRTAEAELATCRAIYDRQGYVSTPRCRQLLEGNAIS